MIKAKENTNKNDDIDANKDVLINDQGNERKDSIQELQELADESTISILGTNSQTFPQCSLLCEVCISNTRIKISICQVNAM